MLKKFDEGDWNAFAGCESDEPRVDYELKIRMPEGNIVDAIIVHDGRFVCIYYVEGDDEGFYTLSDSENEATKLADDISFLNAENGFVEYKELTTQMGFKF